MPANLTGTQVSQTYSEVLHVSGGITATESTVVGGTGTESALKIGTDSVAVDNVRMNGNTISTVDANGNLNLTPNGVGNVVISRVAITGGSISGITDLPVADGGTGASTPSGALANFGCGTMATQNATAVAITGGSVKAGTLGFPTGTGGGIVQGTSRTTGVTLDKMCGTITLFAATIAASESDKFVFTNSNIAIDDVVILSFRSGLTAGAAKYYTATVVAMANGSCTIAVGNLDDATIPSAGSDSPVINFAVIKAVSA